MSTAAQHTQEYVICVAIGFVWPVFFSGFGGMFFFIFNDCCFLGISKTCGDAFSKM